MADTRAMNATTPQDPKVALLGKLLKVAKTINGIEKTGRNDHHQYDYVEASHLFRTIREKLLGQKIIVLPSVLDDSVRHEPAIGGRGMVTTLHLYYRFIDTETGAEERIYWAAVGADVGGDKGIYKAYTGGLKYALLGAFLIPTGEDPEADKVTPQPQVGVTKDAERPAAPRIPEDRAKLILNAAVVAGLASRGEDGTGAVPVFTPVLKAKLATLGVEKIGALDVDQAEEVEAFIAAEAAA